LRLRRGDHRTQRRLQCRQCGQGEWKQGGGPALALTEYRSASSADSDAVCRPDRRSLQRPVVSHFSEKTSRGARSQRCGAVCTQHRPVQRRRTRSGAAGSREFCSNSIRANQQTRRHPFQAFDHCKQRKYGGLILCPSTVEPVLYGISIAEITGEGEKTKRGVWPPSMRPT
jgi:hypothetical protein